MYFKRQTFYFILLELSVSNFNNKLSLYYIMLQMLKHTKRTNVSKTQLYCC